MVNKDKFQETCELIAQNGYEFQNDFLRKIFAKDFKGCPEIGQGIKLISFNEYYVVLLCKELDTDKDLFDKLCIKSNASIGNNLACEWSLEKINFNLIYQIISWTNLEEILEGSLKEVNIPKQKSKFFTVNL